MKNNKHIVYVLMQSKVEQEKKIVEKSQKYPGVTEAIPVNGENDVVVRIELENLSVLDQVVTQIRRVPGIIRTTTLISRI